MNVLLDSFLSNLVSTGDQWCRQVTSGVPQGSVLFLIFVNYVTDVADGIELKLFADDVKLYAVTDVGRRYSRLIKRDNRMG